MKGSEAMIDMTSTARERLDNYLQRVRAELRGTRLADEVEQSVREHIEIALAGAHAPVGATDVNAVLDRLGPPERWLSDEERPAWRRAIAKLHSGSTDWRLAYLAFGLFLASIVLLPIGIGVLLIIPAMLVSRAYVELARDRGESLGARRWLVYPSIAVVLAVATGLLIVAAPLPALALAFDPDVEPLWDIPRSKFGEIRFTIGLGAVVFGSWWIIAGAFCAAFIRAVQFVFAPLLDGLRRKHFAVLAAIGALVAAGGATLIYYRY